VLVLKTKKDKTYHYSLPVMALNLSVEMAAESRRRRLRSMVLACLSKLRAGLAPAISRTVAS